MTADRIKALEDALRKLELANDRVCGARSQRVYNLMIASGMSDALLELDCARAEARAALAASQPAQPVAARVKPLVWSDDPSSALDCAWIDDFGLYQITDEDVLFVGHNHIGWQYPTIADAKAAAQADYEARIMAALEVQPLTMQDAARDVAYDAFMAECRVIYPVGHIEHNCTSKSAFWAGWAAALRAIAGGEK